MFDFIGIPFGWIMYWIMNFVKNYGVALILFTLFTKLILVPVAIKQQKSTMKMQSFQPKIQKIQKQYANNKEKLNEETMKLYSEEGVNPMSSCLPLVIQMPIMMGLYYVIAKPITYLLHFSKDTIALATKIVVDNQAVFDTLKGVKAASLKARSESYVIKAIQEATNNGNTIFSDNGIGADVIDKISNFDYTFLGFNMGDKPSFGSFLILIPIISFLVNLVLMVYTQKQTKKVNPGKQPGGMGMNAMMYVMPLFSAGFAYTVPAGLGIYWIFSSFFSFIQTVILYRIYTPEKMEEVFAKQKNKKKKNGKISMYQRAMEAQAAQNGTSKKLISSSDVAGKKPSKSEMKDYQRQALNEARRRMAEKYGDEYDNGSDD